MPAAPMSIEPALSTTPVVGFRTCAAIGPPAVLDSAVQRMLPSGGAATAVEDPAFISLGATPIWRTTAPDAGSTAAKPSAVATQTRPPAAVILVLTCSEICSARCTVLTTVRVAGSSASTVPGVPGGLIAAQRFPSAKVTPSSQAIRVKDSTLPVAGSTLTIVPALPQPDGWAKMAPPATKRSLGSTCALPGRWICLTTRKSGLAASETVEVDGPGETTTPCLVDPPGRTAAGIATAAAINAAIPPIRRRRRVRN